MTDIAIQPAIRDQLIDRRETIEREIARAGDTGSLARLLDEVNGAVKRLDEGTFGICESCHDPIEAERIAVDPLIRFCLDHLSASEQRALERDLELAARVQRGLPPPTHARINGWEIDYQYEPAGMVSGDYCDYVATDSGDLYFMLGDVSGKGVAASMLMAHLHATLRTLVLMRLPLGDLMERASRLFAESALPPQYATLVCGRATSDGEIELANAGHPPPLVIRSTGVDRIDATGLPLGMFRTEQFGVNRLSLLAGETFLLYTDGVIEAQDGSGNEYGGERMAVVAAASQSFGLQDLVSMSLGDLARFRSGAKRTDDVAIMAIRRTGVDA